MISVNLEPLEKRPVSAVGSAGLLLLGVAITGFGFFLYFIGWLTARTAENSVMPEPAVLQAQAQEQMLAYAGSWLAFAGTPIIMLGILAVVVVWLIMD